jgi:hypothetical protein
MTQYWVLAIDCRSIWREVVRPNQEDSRAPLSLRIVCSSGELLGLVFKASQLPEEEKQGVPSSSFFVNTWKHLQAASPSGRGGA